VELGAPITRPFGSCVFDTTNQENDSLHYTHITITLAAARVFSLDFNLPVELSSSAKNLVSIQRHLPKNTSFHPIRKLILDCTLE